MITTQCEAALAKVYMNTPKRRAANIAKLALVYIASALKPSTSASPFLYQPATQLGFRADDNDAMRSGPS
jgi:hypothetical protein